MVGKSLAPQARITVWFNWRPDKASQVAWKQRERQRQREAERELVLLLFQSPRGGRVHGGFPVTSPSVLPLPLPPLLHLGRLFFASLSRPNLNNK